MSSTPETRSRRLGRLVLGSVYVVAGTLHFVATQRYVAIMPHYLPAARTLVLISGAAEIAGGLGVLLPVPAVRRLAAIGLVALLVAVFPANLEMAMHPERFAGIPGWALWVRLPLQVPLIWWAWRYAEPARRSGGV